jgi:hypothetical protein
VERPVIMLITLGVAVLFLIVRHTLLDQDLLIVEVSRSPLETQHSVGLLWTSDRPDSATST